MTRENQDRSMVEVEQAQEPARYAAELHKALRPEQVQHPGGKNGMWRCACSCGKYLSGFYGYPGHAEMAATAHAKAKS